MSNLAKTIRIFSENPKFTVEDKLADFNGRPNSSLYIPKVNYDELTQAYGLPKNDFRERVAVLTNPQDLDVEDPNYKINWITSVDVRAANARKLGQVEPFFQLAAIGVTVTRDNQIVLGVRGGAVTPERIQQYASGLYGLAPGGSVTFNPNYKIDPIMDTLVNEFHEEIGCFKILNSKHIGIFEAYRPGPTGIKFVGDITTDATLEQIQQDNILANKLEEALKLKGAARKDIDEELREKLLPTDAWEHLHLIGIPNSSYAIRKMIESQPQSFSGIGAGALELYAQYLDSK